MAPKHYVYRNLRTKSFSVRYKGKVISHRDSITLRDVAFKVSQRGRNRVLATKRKNVHATVAGTPTHNVCYRYAEEVYYNPYKTKTFILKHSGTPVLAADYVLCKHNRIFILR